MGIHNTRPPLTIMHSEPESLIWVMECIINLRQYQITFVTSCSIVVKMVFEQEECLLSQHIWKSFDDSRKIQHKKSFKIN